MFLTFKYPDFPIFCASFYIAQGVHLLDQSRLILYIAVTTNEQIALDQTSLFLAKTAHPRAE